MYAIVETGGKQYKVSAGVTVDVELLSVDAGDQVQLDRVLMVVDGELRFYKGRTYVVVKAD